MTNKPKLVVHPKICIVNTMYIVQKTLGNKKIPMGMGYGRGVVHGTPQYPMAYHLCEKS